MLTEYIFIDQTGNFMYFTGMRKVPIRIFVVSSPKLLNSSLVKKIILSVQYIFNCCFLSFPYRDFAYLYTLLICIVPDMFLICSPPDMTDPNSYNPPTEPKLS